MGPHRSVRSQCLILIDHPSAAVRRPIAVGQVSVFGAGPLEAHRQVRWSGAASGIGGVVSKGFVAAVLAVLLAGGSLLAYAFRLRVDTFAEWNRQLELANAEAEHVRQSIVIPSDQRVRAGKLRVRAAETRPHPAGGYGRHIGGPAGIQPVATSRRKHANRWPLRRRTTSRN